MITAYKSKQWEDFGKNIGDALDKLLVGNTPLLLVAKP